MHYVSNSKQAFQMPRGSVQLHGLLLRVDGTGVLLLGESGSGKSRCALELILGGHALVADDVVEVFSRNGRIIGRAPELIRSLLAIRGVGIVDVSEILGKTAVAAESHIDLCIEICDGSVVGEAGGYPLLGYRIPRFVFARRPGQKLAAFVKAVISSGDSADIAFCVRQEAPVHALLT